MVTERYERQYGDQRIDRKIVVQKMPETIKSLHCTETVRNWSMHRLNPVRKCNETKDVDPMMRLLVDAPTYPDDDSERRRLWVREVTVAMETHIGLHITETKYATQKTEVFGKKDITRESVVNKTGGALLEVGFRDKDMAMDVLQRLKHKYAGLEGDEAGKNTDIGKNKENGLFTLFFTNSKRKRYMATMEKFNIFRGLGAEDQVLVAFHLKATGLSTAIDK
jgi:hypothetical protein